MPITNKTYKDKNVVTVTEFDDKGRLITISSSDGFREEIEYQGDTDKYKRVETWYPKGQHEVEYYGAWR